MDSWGIFPTAYSISESSSEIVLVQALDHQKIYGHNRSYRYIKYRLYFNILLLWSRRIWCLWGNWTKHHISHIWISMHKFMSLYTIYKNELQLLGWPKLDINLLHKLLYFHTFGISALHQSLSQYCDDSCLTNTLR